MSALTPYDAMVAELVELGVPREKAIARARQEFCMSFDSFDVEADAIEDEHRREGRRLMLALGFEHKNFSQKRRSKLSEGIPDDRFWHRRRRLFVWWEAKAEWGRQSPAQRNFQEMCDATGDPYVLGGIDALKTWLAEQRVASFENGNPEPMHA